MKLTMQPYKSEEDYWRIREFLRQVMLGNQRREYSWHVARLDYWWWFVNPDIEKITPDENVFIWESETGQIAAVLTPEGRGHVYPQVHPDFHSPAMAEELVAVAEERLAVIGKDGLEKLWFYIDSQDRVFQEVLTRHGFQRVDKPGVQEIQHRRDLDVALSDPFR